MNVFVILGKTWNKNRLVEDLKGEGYEHNFYVGDINKPNEFQKHMAIADEVWYFGNCEGNIMLMYAERNGFDCWEMG